VIERATFYYARAPGVGRTRGGGPHHYQCDGSFSLNPWSLACLQWELFWQGRDVTSANVERISSPWGGLSPPPLRLNVRLELEVEDEQIPLRTSKFRSPSPAIHFVAIHFVAIHSLHLSPPLLLLAHPSLAHTRPSPTPPSTDRRLPCSFPLDLDRPKFTCRRSFCCSIFGPTVCQSVLNLSNSPCLSSSFPTHPPPPAPPPLPPSSPPQPFLPLLCTS